MTQEPPGAQVSPDGEWWWDAANERWQPRAGAAVPAAAAVGSDGDADHPFSSAQHQSVDPSTQSSQDPNEQHVAFDAASFPTLMMYAQYDSFEALAAAIGIDVATVQSDDDQPVA